MTNRNKRRGDTFEAAQRDYFRTHGFPGAERTKAGYERDGGDIHLDPVVGIAPGVICQAKNWGETNWRKWFDELRAQTATAHADVGFLAVKRRGISDPGEQLAVMPVREMLMLLRRAGYGQSLVCGTCSGTGTVECWSPGGPCPDRGPCEACGPCQECVPESLTAEVES